MSNLSPEEMSFLQQTRAKALNREATLDDMRRCIALMRGNRLRAIEASAAGRTSRAKATPKASGKSADAMLDELENL